MANFFITLCNVQQRFKLPRGVTKDTFRSEDLTIQTTYLTELTYPTMNKVRLESVEHSSTSLRYRENLLLG